MARSDRAPARAQSGCLLAGLLLLGSCAYEPYLPADYRARSYDEKGQAPVREPRQEIVYDDSEIRDLELATARELALLRHPDARAAAAAIDAAEAEVRRAYSAFLPELTMGIRRTHFDQVRSVSGFGGASFNLGGADQTSGDATLTLSIFAFGRDLERLKSREAAVATAGLEERRVRQALLLAVDRAWLAVHEADAQIAVAQDALEAAARQHQDAANLFESGRATKDAVLVADVEEKSRAYDLLLVRNASVHARRVLNTLLLRRPEAPVALAPPPPWEEVGIDIEAVRGLAREHNPSLLAFRTRAIELGHLRESVGRSLLPEVTGSLGAEYTDFTEATGYSTNYSATVGIGWTPYSGGRDLAELDRLHADLVRLREQEIAAVLDLDVRIARTATGIGEAEAEHRWTEQSIGASEEALRILSDRFRAGRATAREILESQSTVSSARFRQTRSRFRHLALIAELEADVGLPRESWLGKKP